MMRQYKKAIKPDYIPYFISRTKFNNDNLAKLYFS